jgi:hypothetical protein
MLEDEGPRRKPNLRHFNYRILKKLIPNVLISYVSNNSGTILGLFLNTNAKWGALLRSFVAGQTEKAST